MNEPHVITVGLAGDVMTGRGVDQLFAARSDPHLFEPGAHDAREYVALAEHRHGAIPRPVRAGYIWGDAPRAWQHADARLVNLETAVTTSEDHDPQKDIHYRMHPANVGCLASGGVDVCALANNHLLDWGIAGLLETIDTLEAAGVHYAGAGRDADTAKAPAIVPLRHGRLLVYAAACGDSGVPASWAAGVDRAGLHRLPDLTTDTARAWIEHMRRGRKPGDRLVASIHWGGNWGFDVPASHVAFAHALVDGGVDLVHGHSSHHPRPIEVYRQKLILYGCGDLLNDYEGIGGYEEYRGELSLIYLVGLDERSGHLERLRLVPQRIRAMRLEHAAPDDTAWLRRTLDRVSGPFGIRIAAQGPDLIAMPAAIGS